MPGPERTNIQLDGPEIAPNAFSLVNENHPGRKPTTARVAVWSARHRWVVIAAWLVATVGLFVASRVAGGIRTDDPIRTPNQAQTESARAYAIFDAAGSGVPSEDVTLVVTHPTEHVTDPEFHDFVSQTVHRLTALTITNGSGVVPVFDPIQDPLTAPPQASLVAPDGTAVRIVARITGSPDEIGRHLAPVRAALTAIEVNQQGFTVHGVNQTVAAEDVTALINSGLDRTFVTIGLTFVILVITFAALVAALVPLVLAATSLVAAFGILGLFSQLVTPASPYAAQLVVLIGLAVSVDYSLFLITRFRSERRRGRSKLAAIEVASSTAGRSIFFSGVAVAISVGGLFLIDVSIFRSMAIGTLGVIMVAVIGSLTFLPATLAILGDGIDAGRVPRLGRGIEGTGIWAGLVSAVLRQPVGLASIYAAALLIAAMPILSLHIGLTDFTSLPDQIDGVQAVKLLEAKWPQGEASELQVVVTGFDRADTKAAIATVAARGLTIRGLGEPVRVIPSSDGTVALVSFAMAGNQNDPEAQAIVRQMRTSVVPAAIGGLVGVKAYVTGSVATALDVTQIYTDATPLVFGFVLGLSFLLLLVVFHSIVIPLKAIALNLLSTAAAYGLLVAVFENGILGNAFGLARSSVIESWVPVFIFTILFGLSMDYHVFILTRVREFRDRGFETKSAVAQGIAITAGTVTSAATIMVLVFAAFISIPFAFIQELGLGLALAVLIDATIVRSVLLPATMTLLGDWNWWLPSFLGWLPRMTIESEPESEHQVRAA